MNPITILQAKEINLAQTAPGKELGKFCPKDELLLAYRGQPVVTHCSLQGPRKEMEDAHLDKEKEGIGRFIGVFDGHGDGAKMAKYVSAVLPSAFKHALTKKGLKSVDQIRSVFEQMFQYLQRGLKKDLAKNSGGTCALVGFIPEGSSVLYTATVGDSEAALYRDGKVIPLSKVETWKDPKPLARARGAMNDPDWMKDTKKDAKHIHYPGNYIGGVNVPTTLGDFAERAFGYNVEGSPTTVNNVAKQAISLIPTSVTAVRLREKDKIIFACDGLWDYGSEKEIQSIVEKDGKNLAKELAHTAVDIWQKKKGSGDNVTVIAWECVPKQLSSHTY